MTMLLVFKLFQKSPLTVFAKGSLLSKPEKLTTRRLRIASAKDRCLHTKSHEEKPDPLL